MHSLGLNVLVNDYTNLACQPLFHNKWVPLRDPVTRCIPGSIDPANNQVTKLLGHLGPITVGELFQIVNPAPRTEYRYTTLNSRRYNLITAQEALNKLSPRLNFPVTVWQDILDTVPTWIRKFMCEGPELLYDLNEGWGALQVDNDDPQGNIGDIYYFTKGSKPKEASSWRLYWYTKTEDGQSLELQGWNLSVDQGWLPTWSTNIVPYLRRLAVTVLDNIPHTLGWADEVLSLIHI